MKLLCGMIVVLLLSGCAGVWVPRCYPPIEADIKAVERITNTPCAAKLYQPGKGEATYVIIHSTFGYLGEEKP